MGRGLALTAILVVAFVVTFWRPLRRVRTALGFDHLISTGHAFLLVGCLIGIIFGDRPMPLVDDLSPIVAFVAGWVGFATGMRFDLRILRTLPLRAFVVALSPGTVSALVVGAIAALVLVRSGKTVREALAATFVLAAAAASSGPTLVAMIRSRRLGRSSRSQPVLQLLEFSTGIDDLIVIVLAVVGFALFRTSPEPVPPISLIVVAVIGSALLGVVAWLFLGGRANEDERLLLGLAMLAFIAGFAGWIQVAPAAMTAISAMVLVNLPGDRMAQLVHAVRRVERPAVVILMTVIGFHIIGRLNWTTWPLLSAMTLIRLATNRWTGNRFLNTSTGVQGLRPSRHWGDGLAPQGTLGMVVTLSFFHVWRDDLSRIVLATVAAASMINEIVAPWLLFRLLQRIESAQGMGRHRSLAGGPSA
jgi:hypothetical protein